MNWILDKVLKIASGKKAEDQVTEHDKAVQNDFAKSLMDINEDKIAEDEAALQAGMEDARGVDRTQEFDEVGAIMAYESGELDDQGTLELFSHLIQNGHAWSLQGSYGRTAKQLINAGYIDERGTILKSVGDKPDIGASKKSEIQKIAAYEKDDTSAETVEKDHKLRISGLSDYNLAELLAEAETYEKQTATLNFNEEKEKQLKSVKSDRSAAETKAWNLYKDHVHDDWKKTWEGFRAWENKPATEDDLYGKKDSKKNWRTNDKDFKAVSDDDKEKDMEGVGAEEEKGQVGKEASKKEASEVYCSNPDCESKAHDKCDGKYYCPKHLPEKTEKKADITTPEQQRVLQQIKKMFGDFGIVINETDPDFPVLEDYIKQHSPDLPDPTTPNPIKADDVPPFETKDDAEVKEEVVDLEMPPEETKDLSEEMPLGEPIKLEKPKENVDDKVTKKIEEKIEEKTDEIVEKIEDKIEEHADEMTEKVETKVEEKIDEAFEKHQVEEHPHDEKKEEVDEKEQDEDIKDLKDEHKEDDKKDDDKEDDHKEDEKPEPKDDFGPEIESKLSQRDIVATLKKHAEVDSPWKVITDENGKEVVARTSPSKNEKVSKEDEDENKKLSKDLQ